MNAVMMRDLLANIFFVKYASYIPDAWAYNLALTHCSGFV